MEVMIELTESELNEVSGGSASASLTITSLTASGPTSATVSADKLSITASTVGGLSPSNSANVSGTFTASSS